MLLFRLLAAVTGLLLVLFVLWDGFRSVILPRRVTARLNLSWLLYRILWPRYARLVAHTGASKRERLLSIYSPLALLLQIALWAIGLIVGFALLQSAVGIALSDPLHAPDLGTALYFSGVTFLTLGFGDVAPVSPAARLLAVIESGIGFGFLALVIGYLPMYYSAFSEREQVIAILDARAGSPPTAVEFLRRCLRSHQIDAFLADGEGWAATLLESQMSYPALGLFRSQHERQSWVAALTALLDSCALIMAGIDGSPADQARLTFAMARHAAVDLVQVYDIEPQPLVPDRLSPAAFAQMQAVLSAAGITITAGQEAEERLRELRELYEPYVSALGIFLLMPLPDWLPSSAEPDAWEASPYDDVHWQMLSSSEKD